MDAAKLKGVTTCLKDIQERLRTFIFRETVLVGHSLENDLMALEMVHTTVLDTSVLFESITHRKSKLKDLAMQYFNVKIQQGPHDSADDAKLSLSLAKLKIEILVYIQKNDPKGVALNILEKMTEQKQKVLCLDQEKHVLPLLSKGIHYQPLKQNDLASVVAGLVKWNGLTRESACGLTVARFEESGLMGPEECVALDAGLQRVYESAPANSSTLYH